MFFEVARELPSPICQLEMTDANVVAVLEDEVLYGSFDISDPFFTSRDLNFSSVGHDIAVSISLFVYSQVS